MSRETYRYPTAPEERYVFRMSEALQSLIEKRLKAIGKSARAASIDAGLGPDGIRNVLRGKSQSLRGDRPYKLAQVLQISAEELIRAAHPDLPEEEYVPFTEEGSHRVEMPYKPSGMRVVGEAAAGVWLERIDWDESRFGYVPVVPDPRFEFEKQFVIRVRGDSINKVARDGEYLLCVEVGEMPLVENDLVVVERTRESAGVRETTIKRVKWARSGDGVELWPESTKKQYQEPVPLLEGAAQADEEVTVAVIGTVLWKVGYVGPSDYIRSLA